MFLNMQSPPIPSYLVPLKHKYLSQRRILEHPEPMLPPLCDRPSFTPTHNCKVTSLYILIDKQQLLLRFAPQFKQLTTKTNQAEILHFVADYIHKCGVILSSKSLVSLY